MFDNHNSSTQKKLKLGSSTPKKKSIFLKQEEIRFIINVYHMKQL